MTNEEIKQELYLESSRSKDPNTRVGCLILKEDKIIGRGFNCHPLDKDMGFPWEREAEHSYDTKYPYVVHAEMRAILNAKSSVKGGTLYVSIFPCSTCAKLIITAKIKEIFFRVDKYEGSDDDIAAKKLLDTYGIPYSKF